jgi:hypothetical protein
MIPLSVRTLNLASVLFEEPELTRIKNRLVDEASDSLPFCKDATPEGMERIRYSIMKLIFQNKGNEDIAFHHAKMDWRDLFMAAGFGYSAAEHENWYRQTVEKSQ